MKYPNKHGLKSKMTPVAESLKIIKRNKTDFI
jgi:hypothetical protein